MNINCVRSTSEKFLIGCFSIFILFSCDNGEVKDADSSAYQATTFKEGDQMIGTWNAEWHTKAEAFVGGMDKSLTMNGEIHFKDNGKVTIHAYGYNGCIFMSDTMTNELHYVISGDTLNLMAEEDSFGLPYQIIESKDNLMKLVLMDEIALTLSR